MSTQRTEKQIETSRLNGAKSHGPVTEAGKRKSSRNALRHGRLASSFVLSLENEVEFRESLRDLCNEHQPATPTEHRLVEAMAIAQWQQYRIMNAVSVAYDERVETGRQNPPAYKHQGAMVLSNAVTGLFEDSPALTKMNVERSRLERDYMRALAMLQKMQDRRQRRGLSPVLNQEEEPENPEIAEAPDCPAQSSTPIGLKNEQISAEIPANSLKTIETPRVRFSEASHLETTPESGTGFSLSLIPASPTDPPLVTAALPPPSQRHPDDPRDRHARAA